MGRGGQEQAAARFAALLLSSTEPSGNGHKNGSGGVEKRAFATLTTRDRRRQLPEGMQIMRVDELDMISFLRAVNEIGASPTVTEDNRRAALAFSYGASIEVDRDTLGNPSLVLSGRTYLDKPRVLPLEDAAVQLQQYGVTEHQLRIVFPYDQLMADSRSVLEVVLTPHGKIEREVSIDSPIPADRDVVDIGRKLHTRGTARRADLRERGERR